MPRWSVQSYTKAPATGKERARLVLALAPVMSDGAPLAWRKLTLYGVAWNCHVTVPPTGTVIADGVKRASTVASTVGVPPCLEPAGAAGSPEHATRVVATRHALSRPGTRIEASLNGGPGPVAPALGYGG